MAIVVVWGMLHGPLCWIVRMRSRRKAVEHANKIDDDITRGFILNIIDEVYALPEQEIKTDVDAAREKVRAEFTEKCIATPHDKMPDYKPF